jgi:hypothetical protein
MYNNNELYLTWPGFDKLVDLCKSGKFPRTNQLKLDGVNIKAQNNKIMKTLCANKNFHMFQWILDLAEELGTPYELNSLISELSETFDDNIVNELFEVIHEEGSSYIEQNNKNLQWLAKNCPLDQNACEIAAKHGNLEILKWLKENDYELTENVHNIASNDKNEELVKWLNDNGCRGNEVIAGFTNGSMTNSQFDSTIFETSLTNSFFNTPESTKNVQVITNNNVPIQNNKVITNKNNNVITNKNNTVIINDQHNNETNQKLMNGIRNQINNAAMNKELSVKCAISNELKYCYVQIEHLLKTYNFDVKLINENGKSYIHIEW